MDLFLHIVLSFPTAIFSFLLLVVVGYWLLALLGFAGLDAVELSGGQDGASVETGGLAGMLHKFGLDGVPITFIASTIVLIAWFISYFGDYFLLQQLPFDALRWLFGGGVALAALLLAIPFTGLAIRPLQGLFVRSATVTSESLLGRSVVVRSPEVDEQRGTATLDDGGAGLILQVRAAPGEFRRGDSAVLIEYIDAQNSYRIIKESR